MSAQEVVVLRGALAVPAADGSDLLPFEELRRRIVGGEALSLLFRWRKAVLRTHRLDLLSKPLNTALVLRAMSRGSCRFEDEEGKVLKIGPLSLVALLGRPLPVPPEGVVGTADADPDESC